LKPKNKLAQQNLIISNGSGLYAKTISNNSALYSKNTQSESKLPQRPLTAAYTFKLKSPVITRKKHDPVSLFQQTSSAWKKDKFLTNRANNKEGRKLDLDKRNR
jgi:hypothetical protein